MAVGGENAAQAEIARANADLAEAEASAKQRADVATANARLRLLRRNTRKKNKLSEQRDR